MVKLSDEWCTPQYLFDELNDVFNFDIDLCATNENHKCNWYGVNYLEDSYANAKTKESTKCHKTHDFGGNSVFMNPPYSNPKPFIEKAWEDSKKILVVCLVKCDTSTKWWGTFWCYDIDCPFCDGSRVDSSDRINNISDRDYNNCSKCNGRGIYNGPKSGCEVRFLSKRIKFEPPKKWGGQTSGSAFPSALIFMDRRN